MCGVAFGEEAIGAVGAGYSREGAGSVVVAGIVGYCYRGCEGCEREERHEGGWELHLEFEDGDDR